MSQRYPNQPFPDGDTADVRMDLETLDPALLLAFSDFVASPDETQAARRISVVLHYSGDLAPIEALGFEVAWSNPTRAIGRVSFGQLEQIARHANVLRIVAGSERLPDLDTAAEEARARATTTANIGTDGLWHVAKPAGTLTVGAGASGKGIVVGIIDTGIDVTHPSFARDLTQWDSRILHVWDQGMVPNVGEAGPDDSWLGSDKTYGVEFNKNDVDTAISNSLWPLLPVDFRHSDCNGHGTHVAGIAAGGSQVSGGSDGSFVGVAPEAHIIAVKLLDGPGEIRDVDGDEVGWDVRFQDAVLYILRRARAIPAPVVINASFGNTHEPGDGLDDDAIFLDDTFDPAAVADDDHFPSGAIYIKSAGNSGRDTERTFAIVTIPDAGEIIVPFELYDERGASTRKIKNCVSTQFVPDMWVTAWYREVAAPGDVSVAARVPTDAAFSDPVFSGSLTKRFDGGKRRTLYHSSFGATRPAIGANPSTAVTRNRMLMIIEPKKLPAPAAPLHLHGSYDLEFKGPPGTRIYVTGTRQGTPAGRTGMRVATQYRNGDPLPGAEIVNGSANPIELIDVTSEQTIADGGGRNIITVAAYDDLNGEVTDFSSRGPLRDYTDAGLGPIADKPDVAGPGKKLNASLSISTDEAVGRVGINGTLEGNRFTEKSGTSMSAPMVAGVVTLMLEKNDALTVDQIRTALDAAARDGANPGPADSGYASAFGSGKVTALESHQQTPP